MEHYKQMMGEMEALEYVENEIKDLLNRQEVDDE
jgi:translation elongation factor EF-Tu-like GTPase